MTFTKIKVGDYVYDKAQDIDGHVRHIDHESNIAEVEFVLVIADEGSFTQKHKSRLHDLVRVQANDSHSEPEEDSGAELYDAIVQVADDRINNAQQSKIALEINIKYFNKDLTKLTKFSKGDWIDLRAAETVELKAGEFKLIPLGVGMKLPEDFEANVVPRSSTFKNYGIIQTNSLGVIDNSYSGNDDQWMMPVYATRDAVINFNDRICQFRINKKMPKIVMNEVECLDEVNRGGFGSTGVK